MEIEVGDFVRTRNQGIKRVDTIFENKTVNRYGYECSSDWDGKWYSYIKTTDIVKHSKHIIELIELGDIVECMVAKLVENGTEEEETIKYEVVATKVLDMNGNPINEIEISGEEGPELISFENVRSILTHEQFEQNCYRLEE